MKLLKTLSALIVQISSVCNCLAQGSESLWQVKKQGLVNNLNTIGQTVFLPSAFQFPVSRLNENQIRSTFATVVTMDLPTEYIKDCCFERGYKASSKIRSLGIQHIRVIVTGKHLPLRDKWDNKIEWLMHTAPGLVDEKNRIWIIDPALNKSPVLLNEWLNKFANPQIEHQLIIANEYIFDGSQIDDPFVYSDYLHPQIKEVVVGGLLGCGYLQDTKNKRLSAERSNSNLLLTQNLSHTRENNVSDFWSQQLVGLDLTRELISTLQKSGLIKLSTPTIHIWDEEINTKKNDDPRQVNHAYSVSSFFTPGAQSSTEVAQIGQNQDVIYNFGGYEKALKELPLSEELQLINLSAGWRFYSDRIKNSIRGTIHKNALIVKAAGNRTHRGLQDVEFEPEDSNLIRVGSLRPDGLISDYSAVRGDYLVYAPSDGFLTARASSDGQYTNFKGTSGAAPLVTGAIANILAIRPSLKPEQIKKLIDKTAFIFKDKESRFSTKVINSFQMLLSVLPQSLKDRIVTDITAQLNQAVSHLKVRYPQCWGLGQPESDIYTHNTISESFSVLRKNFYLLPSVELADQISCLYRSQKYISESHFFSNWSASQRRVLSLEIVTGQVPSKTLLRNIEFLSDDDAKYVIASAIKENKQVFQLAEGHDPAYLVQDSDIFVAILLKANLFKQELFNYFKSLTDWKDRNKFLNKIISFQEARRLIYPLAAQDVEYEIRNAVLDVFANTEDVQLKKKIFYLIHEDNERTWMKMINLIDNYEPEFRGPVAKFLITVPSEDIQMLVLKYVFILEKSIFLEVLDLARQSQFKQVREQALQFTSAKGAL